MTDNQTLTLAALSGAGGIALVVFLLVQPPTITGSFDIPASQQYKSITSANGTIIGYITLNPVISIGNSTNKTSWYHLILAQPKYAACVALSPSSFVKDNNLHIYNPKARPGLTRTPRNTTETSCSTDENGEETCTSTTIENTSYHVDVGKSNEINVTQQTDWMIGLDTPFADTGPWNLTMNFTSCGIPETIIIDPVISVCPFIANTTNDALTLTADLVCSGTSGITMNATGQSLDCGGYWINGTNASATFGITIQNHSQTVRNCQIQGFQYGINTKANENASLVNNRIYVYYNNTGYGILAFGSKNLSIQNSSVFINTSTFGTSGTLTFNAEAINLSGTGGYQSLYNVSIWASNHTGEYGIRTISENSTFNDLNVNGTYIGFASGSSSPMNVSLLNSFFNQTYATSCSATSTTGQGVPIFSRAKNSFIINNTVNQNAACVSPAIEEFSSNGNNLIENNTVASGANGIVLYTNSGPSNVDKNSVVNGNNITVTTTSSQGIVLNGVSSTFFKNMTITNNWISDATSSSYNQMKLQYINNSLIQNNVILGGGGQGLAVPNTVLNTVIRDNVVRSSGYSLYIAGSASTSNLTFINNTFNTSWVTTTVGAVYLNSYSGNHNFTNNTFNSVGTGVAASAIYFGTTGAHDCTFTGNILNVAGTNPAISISTPSGNNIFTKNNITATKWISDANYSAIAGTTNNFNDSMAGNIYYFPNGTLGSGSNAGSFNWTYSGSSPYWADGGNQTPMNATWDNTSAHGVGGNTYFAGAGNPQDWHPWTNFTLTSMIHNANLVITVLTANTTDGQNLSNENINCNGTMTTNDTGTMTFRGSWLRNGTNMTSLNWSIAVTNNTNTILSTLASANFGATDNISCTGYVDDGINQSAQNWSNNVTVLAPSGTPDISCGFAPSVKAIVFNVSFGTGTTANLVYPINQTNPAGTYQCTNNGTASGNLQAKLNDTYASVSEVASWDYFTTSNLVLSTSYQTLKNIAAGDQVNVSLYRNYSAIPTRKTVAINFSIS